MITQANLMMNSLLNGIHTDTLFKAKTQRSTLYQLIDIKPISFSDNIDRITKLINLIKALIEN